MDKIILNGIEFYSYGGVSKAEREVGQRYVVDVELIYDLRAAAASDDVADTINYSEVYRAVLETARQTKFHLIETLAQRMADTLLQRFPAQEVFVRLRKQPPPIDGVLQYAGVEIRRGREDGLR
ncbi:MAG: dihydroneopterin aldolase [Anaerolineae bacterium]